VNERFNAYSFSSSLTDVGVLVHTFDNTESTSSAMSSVHGNGDHKGSGRPWEPCAPHGMWCSSFSDRISASVVNKDVKRMFGSNGGLVISPHLVRTHCSYPHDGGTMSKFCAGPINTTDEDGCRPGCGSQAGSPNWCRPWVGQMREGLDVYQCAWRAKHLEYMMRWHVSHNYAYNEVVIDTSNWMECLPDIIEAVFMIAGQDEAPARRIYAAFKRAYPQSKTMLLRLNTANAPGDVFLEVEEDAIQPW